MTGDFVYEALYKELRDWVDNCDTDKYNCILDYIEKIAYEIGVRGDDTPASIVDNLVVNGDFIREGQDWYEERLESGEYSQKGDGIILI